MKNVHKRPGSTFKTLRSGSVPAILWVVIICLIAISTFHAAIDVKNVRTDRFAVASWAFAMVLNLIVTWWQAIKSILANRLSSLQEKIRTDRVEFLALFLVLGMALLLRTIDLISHPYLWSGDEASMAKLFASETVTYVTHRAVKIHGGMGY